MNFFDEFEALRLKVPRLALMNFKEQSSPYCNYTFKCIDSYFSIASDFLQNSHYNYWGYHNKDCLDCSYCRGCENCFECLDCKNCYNCDYLQDCEDCTDCDYCFDCQNLKNCFACIGLWRKQYHIYNKPYSKEEYEKTVRKLKNKSPEELRNLFKDIKKNRPHIYMHENHNEGGCTGDYVYNSQQCYFCFDIEHCERSRYLNNAINCYDSFDVSFGGEPPLQNCYEIMSGMGLLDSIFCSMCWHGKNLEYCEYCFNCEYCFGCIGLRNRKFYILNVAYSPDEYFERVMQIKKGMKRDGIYGKWFDSAYRFEETIACDESIHILHDFDKTARPIKDEREFEKGLEESVWKGILK